jgi:SAM-dependent methyltransferase
MRIQGACDLLQRLEVGEGYWSTIDTRERYNAEPLRNLVKASHFLIPVASAGIIWVGWRLLCRKRVVPCPALLSWLVEMENPIARVTRSENVVKQLALDDGTSVLDIGCGPGRVTIPLAQAVEPSGKVFALDVQNEMLAKLREKVKAQRLTNVEFVQGDARKQKFPPHSLDAAVSVMALGEVPDFPQIFPAVYSALKPNGQLLISESRFDPHFLESKSIRAHALAAGFVEKACVGNFLAYSVIFERTG